jgi:4-hydroxy-tetrahydrodipicolinate synthase
MSQTILQGIIPPIATPLDSDEQLDLPSLDRFVEQFIEAGVHGLWVLGTTGRFDMLPDSLQLEFTERVVEINRGRVPIVANVSDGGHRRTRDRAKAFDELAIEAYAVLPPWYLKLSAAEVVDYFRSLADTLARPIVIYNAPWVCNQLQFHDLKKLAEHPRIVGCKDVTDDLGRPLGWSSAERRELGFSYMMGTDNLADATRAGSDGFVTSISNAAPELSVAIWNAVRAGESARAFELQARLNRLGAILNRRPGLSGLEAVCRHRGFLRHMLPAPWKSLDEAMERQIIDEFESMGGIVP